MKIEFSSQRREIDLLNSSYPTQPHSLIANYSTLFILTICEKKNAIINVTLHALRGLMDFTKNHEFFSRSRCVN